MAAMHNYGIDVAPTAIARARAKASERGLTARFEVADALGLDRLSFTADTVIDSGMFHVFADGTVRRRLSVVSGFFAFFQARGDVPANPVPRGLPTRRERSRPGQGVPLVRVTRRLPPILSPAEVDALTAALRTHRDRAMVAAMVLGGLRRCRSSGCGWKACAPPSGGCSSPRGKAADSG
jgi:integrase